jgi:hypothetical protein
MCLFRAAVRVSTEETPFNHEVSDCQFNWGQIVHCIVTYAAGI